jgi:excisionase family DNA binding protein
MDIEGNGLSESATAGQLRGRAHHAARPSHPVTQVRGVMVEQMVVSSALDPFLSLRALAAYSGLSVRKLRDYLELPPDQALPCYRVGGKILVRRSEFDAWMERYRSRGRPELARTLKELGLDKGDV